MRLLKLDSEAPGQRGRDAVRSKRKLRSGLRVELSGWQRRGSHGPGVQHERVSVEVGVGVGLLDAHPLESRHGVQGWLLGRSALDEDGAADEHGHGTGQEIETAGVDSLDWGLTHLLDRDVSRRMDNRLGAESRRHGLLVAWHVADDIVAAARLIPHGTRAEVARWHAEAGLKMSGGRCVAQLGGRNVAVGDHRRRRQGFQDVVHAVHRLARGLRDVQARQLGHELVARQLLFLGHESGLDVHVERILIVAVNDGLIGEIELWEFPVHEVVGRRGWGDGLRVLQSRDVLQKW